MTSRDIVSIFVTGARDGVTRVIRRLCVTSIVMVLTSLVLFVWCFFAKRKVRRIYDVFIFKNLIV